MTAGPGDADPAAVEGRGPGEGLLDPRSLRLNFEIDLEVLDHGFARAIERRIETVMATATPVTLAGLRARPYVMRLIDRLIWLGSPYL